MSKNISITSLNKKITVLSDIIQKARKKISDNNNNNVVLDYVTTRKIILLCLLFLSKQKNSAVFPSLTLLDILSALEMSNTNILNFNPKENIRHLNLYDVLLELSSISEIPSGHKLIKYALESLEYSTNEYFNTKSTKDGRNIIKKKKQQGIYYTPTDVVEFMVTQCVTNALKETPTPSIIDCSCGSGIFLLHSLIFLENSFNATRKLDTSISLLKNCIWGIDISPAAIDCCKTIFLQYYIEEYNVSNNQLAVICKILNSSFVIGDATKLDTVISSHKELPRKFDCIIGNPPYVTINKTTNLFIPFVENLITYTSVKSCSALVLPLSICYSQGKDYVNLRNKIQNDAVVWTFMNYDRSPDSLFGDQIKTRNTIVFRNSIEHASSKFSTTLQRWTSTNRSKLFSNFFLCDISDISISNIIPKISFPVELQSFRLINSGSTNLMDITLNHHSAFPLVVNGTAYNWICAYDHIPPSTDANNKQYISSTTKIYYLPDEESRNFCIALLSNRFAYWYWIVTGDGFHINSALLTNYRIGKNNFTETQYKELCQLGKIYARRIKEHPTISYNAGKKIVNYSHKHLIDIIQKIETIIVDALNLPIEFSSHIEQWYLNQVYCNRNNEKR